MKTVPAAAFFAVLMLFAPLSGAKAASITGTVVILVSNNPADLAAAHDLKLMIGEDAVIVQTSWGAYDPDVVQEIEGMNPSAVIIIGGPAAVPEEYQKSLENDGYRVTRLAGDNQYGTFEAVINWAAKNGYTYNGEVYIVDGGNYGEILTLINEGYFVIIDRNNMCISEKLMEKIGAKQAVVDQSLKQVQEKLQNKIEVKTFTKKQLMEKIISHLRVETASTNKTIKTIALMKLDLMLKLQKEGKIDLALQMQASNNMIQVSTNAACMKKMHERNEYMMEYHELAKKFHGKKQYEEILKEIKKLIKEGKYNEAMKLMKELENQSTTTESTTTTMTSTMSWSMSTTMSPPTSMTTHTTTGKNWGG